MQGQRSTFGSFPETIDIDQGSVSNNTGMGEQPSWNNIMNPVESRLSNYAAASSSEAACVNGIGNDVQAFGGWDAGEPSSRLNPQNHIDDDGMKVEHGWPSSFDPRAGAGPRSEERRSEPTNILFPGRVSIGSSSNQVTRRPLFLQSSSSVPQNVNQNAGYAGNSRNSRLVMGSGVCPNLYKSVESEKHQVSCMSTSAENAGTSSGSSGYVEEETSGGGGANSSLGSWGLSCKRKALEGTSGQSYAGGSSSSFPQPENVAWPNGSSYSASSSLSLSTPSWNTSSVCPPEYLNPRFGVSTTGVPSDVFPALGVTGVAENPLRNFGRRVNHVTQQDTLPFNLSSSGSARRFNVPLPHPSPRPVPSSDSFDSRAAALLAGNSSAPQGQSHVIRVTGLSRNAHPFPWNAPSNSRASSSSSTHMSGDRGAALQEEPNLRSVARNNAEHPVLVSPSETRSLGQDPTSWSLATGHISTAGGVPSSSRFGPSSSAQPLPNSAWTSHHNPPTQSLQRLSELSPWSLFPSVDSESGGHSGHFPQLPSGPSSSSQETAMSSRLNQGHHHPYPRSAFLMERHGDDVLGPHSLRALAADIEGRHRLISEIRQVLSAMRRGENLRAEDFMLFDPFIYHGMADMHDRHRDMRLDVDNMSYEELLALGERIGEVSTGLSEETILKSMKQREFISITTKTSSELEPCCICQEQYSDGEDLGTLDCGHDFHTNCIKLWLMQKNLCPICKTKGLHT